MKNLLNDFIKLNYDYIMNKELSEQLLLHIITLYDAQKIDLEIMENSIDKFLNLR